MTATVRAALIAVVEEIAPRYEAMGLSRADSLDVATAAVIHQTGIDAPRFAAEIVAALVPAGV